MILFYIDLQILKIVAIENLSLAHFNFLWMIIFSQQSRDTPYVMVCVENARVPTPSPIYSILLQICWEPRLKLNYTKLKNSDIGNFCNFSFIAWRVYDMQYVQF